MGPNKEKQTKKREKLVYPSQECLKKLFRYHPAGHLIWRKKPAGNVKAGEYAGSYTQKYVLVGINKKTYFLHKLIFIYHKGWMPDIVDHKDRNTRNNWIANLRASDCTGSSVNRGMHSRNKSGFKGVVPNFNGRNGYRAFIGYKKTLIYLGNFSNAVDAAKAYNVASKKLHGKFGVQNYIP